MNKLFSFLIILLPFMAFGQAVHYDSDISARNRQLNHYHKMVSWDDSQYREFTYYETSQYGAIMDFMNWRAIFPPGYDANSNKKYPMIVMLHGAGESGRKWTGRYQYDSSDPRYDNNGHQLLHGGREHRDAVNRNPSHAQAFPGIVIFPQVSYNGVWTGDNILMASLIIEHMIEEYDADPFRIAVHGLSNGAKGVWEFASQRPDLFAAGAPMSGVGTDRDAMTDSLVTMPLWIFQGGTDTNPSPSWSQQWYDELQQKGGKPRYTLYNGVGHGTWTYAYAEPDFFSWILDQDKREIFYFAESLFTPTPSNTLKLGFSAGFPEYQWTRNGVNIPGATERYYIATQGGVYTVKFKQRINNQWAESFEIDLGDSGPVAEVVTIPDANFKAALLADTDINTNDDDEIQVTEAEATGDMDVSGHNIADLTGIEAFTDLNFLNVSDNDLTELDLSNNTELNEIFAANNQLSTLALPVAYVISLDVRNNQLSSLDVSQYADLENFNASGNQLSTLDVSANGTLAALDVSDNQLNSLNVKNGWNHEMYAFDATGNPDLECVQVDDAEAAENSWSDNIDEGVSFSTDCSNTGGDLVVFIPDASFKAALLADAGINTNGDSEIQVTEAEAYSGRINLIGQGISDLTGIEAFTALTDLRVHYNDLTSLDVSANTQLTELHFQGNQISNIDLSANTALVKIRAQNNALTDLVLNANSSLRYLEAQNNALVALQVKNGNNHLMYTFNATGNPDLLCVEVDDVAQAEAEWSDNVDSGVSFSLSCEDGGPVEPVVNIPDTNFKNALLADAVVNTNGDDEIQVSEAEAVTTLDVSGNGIASLTGIGAFTSLSSLNISDNSLTSVDVSEVPYLSSLNADNNQLTAIDFNAFLEVLNLNSNQLGALDLSGKGINSLDVSNNELTSLNLQTGTVLEYLYATNNPGLSCIQVNNVSYYENGNYTGEVDEEVTFSADCNDVGGDPVVFIPDANFKAALLADAAINTNGDSEIQVTEAAAYTGRINLIGQGISDLTGIEAFSALTDLRVHYNALTNLDLSANTQLRELHLQGNQISSIDLSANTALVKLRAQNNTLASLDLSANSSLRYLEAQNNALTSLSVKNGNNSWMYTFNATGNPDLFCVEVDDAAQAEASWSDNVDAGVSFSQNCGGARFAAETASGDDATGESESSTMLSAPSVYPNPFHDQLSVSLPEGTPSNQPLLIYDYLGRLIKNAGHTSESLSVTIEVSDIRAGLYILKIGEHSVRLKKE